MAEKKPIRIPPVYLKKWMATRPYKSITDHDQEYAVLTYEIHQMLMSGKPYFDGLGIESEDLIDLSVIIAAYFEDFISEVGIWNAFVTHNKELYGDWLPFYDLRDYDPDYINAADICFLMWQWITVYFEDEGIFGPESNGIITLGQYLFAWLEDLIDESSATDAHDKFLTLADDIPFFDFREKLNWLVFKSYLFGQLCFGPQIERDLGEHLADFHAEEGTDTYKAYAFDHEMELLFRTKCQLGGLRANEWAARIFRGTPALREKIHAIQPRMKGDFIYLRKEQSYQIVQHPGTGREVAVADESLEFRCAPGTLFYLNLIKWGRDFWVVGMAIKRLANIPDKDLQSASIIPEELMTVEEHENWHGQPQATALKMLELFGAPFVVFANPQAASDALVSIMAEIHKDKTGGYSGQPLSDTSELLENYGEMAMYAIPGEGIGFCPSAPQIIEFLTQPDTCAMDAEEATTTLFREVHPFAVNYIMEHYPTDRLGWPGIHIDIQKNAKFLSTYHFPHEAGIPKPNVSMNIGS